jgi:hypothetical protein
MEGMPHVSPMIGSGQIAHIEGIILNVMILYEGTLGYSICLASPIVNLSDTILAKCIKLTIDQKSFTISATSFFGSSVIVSLTCVVGQCFGNICMRRHLTTSVL